MRILPAAGLLLWPGLVSSRRMDWGGEALKATSSVFVTWELALDTGKQITFLKDSDGTSLLSYACDNKLTVGGVLIEVTADEKGNGEMTVGDAHYTLESTTEMSGGIVCEARWNLDVVVVECEVPWGAVNVGSLETLPQNLTANCLGSNAENDLAIIGTFYDAQDVGFHESLQADENVEVFEEIQETDDLVVRQGPVCQPRRSITKKSDGSPHKWRRHKQLTDRLECRGGPCEMAHGKEYSVTHEAGFSLSGGGKGDWISAGYSVSYTRTTAQVANCGGDKNQVVCVASWRRYQEYTVERATWNICKPNDKKRTTYNTWSPLSGSNEHAFYCKRGGCQGSGHISWEDRGKGKHGGA